MYFEEEKKRDLAQMCLENRRYKSILCSLNTSEELCDKFYFIGSWSIVDSDCQVILVSNTSNVNLSSISHRSHLNLICKEGEALKPNHKNAISRIYGLDQRKLLVNIENNRRGTLKVDDFYFYEQMKNIKSLAQGYLNGRVYKNSMICSLNKPKELYNNFYFIGDWRIYNNDDRLILVSNKSNVDLNSIPDRSLLNIICKAGQPLTDINHKNAISKTYELPPPQSNIDDPPSPSAVSSTNDTEEPKPVSGLGLNQGSGKANTAETSVEVSQRKTDDDERKINSSPTIKQDLTKTGHNKKNKLQKSGAITNIFNEATTKFGENINGKNLAQYGFGKKFFKTVEEYVNINGLDKLITEIYQSDTCFKGDAFKKVAKMSDLKKIVNKKITSKNIGLSAKGLCLMGVAYAYADYIQTESNNDNEKIETAKTILNQLPKTIKNLDRTGLRKTTLVTFTKQIKELTKKVIEKYGWQ